jgi:hypothetical protein
VTVWLEGGVKIVGGVTVGEIGDEPPSPQLRLKTIGRNNVTEIRERTRVDFHKQAIIIIALRN